jgi:hypothetical protein
LTQASANPISRRRPLPAALLVPLVISVAVHGAVAWTISRDGGGSRGGAILRAERADASTTVMLVPEDLKPAAAPPAPTPIPEPEPEPRAAAAEAPAPLPEPTGPSFAPDAVVSKPVLRETKAAPRPSQYRARPEPRRQARVAAPVPAAPSGATFASVSAPRARTVVFAVDTSGVMASTLAFVAKELDRSIAQLEPDQRFQIVLFRSDATDEEQPPVLTWFGGGSTPALVGATSERKGMVRTFLSQMEAKGRADPTAGLRAALSLEPEVVFLLTRNIRRTQTASDESDGAVLEALEALNPPIPGTQRRRTAVKTLQFLEDDPTGLLQRIAAVHGDGEGSYTLVRLESLLGPQNR